MARRFGSIYQRKGREGYYVRFRRDGREIQRFGGKSELQAEKKLARVAALHYDGTPLDEILSKVFGDFHGETLTFAAAVPYYLAYAERHKKRSTIKADAVRLGRILDEAGWTNRYLGAIGTKQLVRWADKRRAGGASGPTVNRDISIVSALFKWAKSLGYCESNPAREVARYSEKGRERETHLTAEEARALVKAATGELRPLLVCALSTGMRRGEILSLSWQAVDFERGTITVEASKEKSGKGRVVPMTDDLATVLRTLRSQRRVFRMDRDDLVFMRETGKPWKLTALRRAFEQARMVLPEEKQSEVTFHTLRHTAASLMVQRGAALFDVSKILGHSSLQMTMRYAHFAPNTGRAAVEKLANALRLRI